MKYRKVQVSVSPLLPGSPPRLSAESFHDSGIPKRHFSAQGNSLPIVLREHPFRHLLPGNTWREVSSSTATPLRVSLKCLPPCQAGWPGREPADCSTFWLNVAISDEKETGRMLLSVNCPLSPAVWLTAQSLTSLCQNDPSASALALFLRTWSGRAIKCILAFSS